MSPPAPTPQPPSAPVGAKKSAPRSASSTPTASQAPASSTGFRPSPAGMNASALRARSLAAARAAAAASLTRPRPPAAKGLGGSSVVRGPIRGQVRDSRLRSKALAQGSIEILTFYVDRFDGAGNRLDSIPVEMQGDAIHGVVADGDDVEIRDDWSPGSTLHPRAIVNHSGGGSIVEQRHVTANAPPAWFITLFVLVALAVASGFAIAIYHALHHSPWP